MMMLHCNIVKIVRCVNPRNAPLLKLIGKNSDENS